MWCFGSRCVDMVKASQYVELANDLEINKAITYLRQRNFNQVRDNRPPLCCSWPSLCVLYGWIWMWHISAHIFFFFTPLSVSLVFHIFKFHIFSFSAFPFACLLRLRYVCIVSVYIFEWVNLWCDMPLSLLTFVANKFSWIPNLELIQEQLLFLILYNSTL